jgi:hypothetical protein
MDKAIKEQIINQDRNLAFSEMPQSTLRRDKAWQLQKKKALM